MSQVVGIFLVALLGVGCSKPGAKPDATQRDDGGPEDSPTSDGPTGPMDASVCPTACDTSPCANGGTCTPSGSTFTCSCLAGFTGATCQGDPLPTASCAGEAVQFPSQITVTGGGSVPGNGAITAYLWQTKSVPTGSTFVLSSPTAPSFSFVPDVAGTYEFCLTVSSGALNSNKQCCRYESAPAFIWTQATAQQAQWGLPTEDPTNVEYVEFNAGKIFFFFSTNQPVSVHSAPTFSSSNPAWSFAAGFGSSQSNFDFVAEPNVSVSSGTAAVAPGDIATTSFVVDATATGEQNVTLSGTVTLTSAVDPGPGTPAIADISFGPLSSTAPSLVKVKFDPARPIADVVEIGGWTNYPTGVVVNDLGVDADQVACDGWFSGTVTLSPGSYDVLVRGRNTAAGKVGPYVRRTVVVF